MIGSDWPVVTLAGTTEQWFGAVLDVVGELAPEEEDAVLSATAAATYGIDR